MKQCTEYDYCVATGDRRHAELAKRQSKLEAKGALVIYPWVGIEILGHAMFCKMEMCSNFVDHKERLCSNAPKNERVV